MKKHIIRALFALLGTAAAILPLLHAPEAQPEYTYGCEMDFRRSREDQLLYFYSSDGIAAQLSAPRYDGYWVDFSLTRASALAIPDCDFDSGGTLYYIDRSGAMPIAEGVHHAIASDCESGAYITELDADRRLGKLNYFRNGKSSCIESRLCTRLNFGLHISPAISPDGKTLAYSRDNGSGGITGMLYHNGKYIELGEDIFPIAVSDNAEYLYYGRLSVPAAETSLETLMPPTDYYVRCGKTDTLIGQGSYAYFLFNRDFSEAIVTADSFSMISAEGGGRLRPFSGHYPTGVLAPQAGLAVEASYGAASAYSTMYTRVGADSFIGKVLHSEWGGFAHDVCMGTKCPYHKTLYLDE